MAPRLFHFSDDATIERFTPRCVRVPARRAPGQEWLNGPLVWAIDDWHQPMYLFPRDCPRILLWRTARTVSADAERYFDGSSARIVAYIEAGWADSIAAAKLYRYELPTESFESLDDAGMWVSRSPAPPLRCDEVGDLPHELRLAGVDLRTLADLTPLKDVWASSLHASGIRLRNAVKWDDHPRPSQPQSNLLRQKVT
jgi:hypothetical protein